MSSWDTNPWSDFCDPHWQVICRKWWHPRTSEISTPPEMARETHLHARHGTAAILVFLPAEGEASWSLLPSSVSLLSDRTVQPKSTYFCILKVTGQVWKNQKRISISTNHSLQHPPSPKPVSTDLTIKSDLVLISPIGKDGLWSWSL